MKKQTQNLVAGRLGTPSLTRQPAAIGARKTSPYGVHRLGIVSDSEPEPAEPDVAVDRTDGVEGTAPPQQPEATPMPQAEVQQGWQALKAELAAARAAEAAKGSIDDYSPQPPSLMHSLARFRRPVLIAGGLVLAIAAVVLASWWLGGDSALPQPALAGGPATAPPGRTTGAMTASALSSATDAMPAAPDAAATPESSDAGEPSLVAGDTTDADIAVTPMLTDPPYQEEVALEIPSSYDESIINQDDPTQSLGIFGQFAMPDPLPIQTWPEPAPEMAGGQRENEPPTGPVVLPPGIELTCVFSGLDGRIAIINGRFVEAGEKIKDVKVITIGESSVEVEYQGQPFTIGLGSRTSGQAKSEKPAEDKP